MRRLLLLAAAAAAALAWVVVGASAAPKKARGERTIKVVQTTTALHFGVGGPATGSTIVLTTTEQANGKQVGTSQTACVTIAGSINECYATTFLANGQIQGQGSVDISQPSSTVSIVGGTGAYKTARGFIERKKLTANTAEVTYHILT